jgi:hypothetical protein
MYFIYNIFTNMLREVFWPRRVGEKTVNKIHHSILKCILLVIHLYLDLMNAWMMEHFFNIVLTVGSTHFKWSFKNVDHLPLFPRHVRPCPYKYIFMVLFLAVCIFPQRGFEVLEGTSSLRLSACADKWHWSCSCLPC